MSIKFLAEDDRPREKFLLKGKNALSDAELLAIIMGSGNRGESAVDLARRILESVGNNWNQLSLQNVKELMKFKGVGEAKAISIATALEIGRRRASQESATKSKITCSKDVFNILHPFLGDLPHEEFWCLYLNQSNKILHKEKLTQGGINQSIVDVRVLFSHALSHLATAIIVAHNHPSGSLSPSSQDIQVTKNIKKAGEILQISLLDHIIITQEAYFSFADDALL
ncbi:DNA repair protein RadC [Elizabethkingia sp. JS20170427COW]|uniref:RadC family protein n=1 Tax=Elizabethkingia sp. JS20170427COW TaxID=2583851 RepID=UPI00111015EA|nr:DNA repair protein RadC [Elizabethkingia sp. JS20170427COW]QCX52340.1 JAB domain-containing protein [Elizabethkingia sp. JS20170427COW]